VSGVHEKAGARSRGARLLLFGLLLLAASSARAETSEDCLACHGEPSLSAERKGRTVSLFVSQPELGASAHRDLACSDCHAGFDPTTLPHRPKIAPIDCLACHGDARQRHAFHPGMARVEGKEAADTADCKDCHGTHAIQGLHPADPGARAAVLVDACKRCHEVESTDYAASEHGRAAAAGVAHAPNCSSCHGKPVVADAAAPGSADVKIAQERLCLACHLDDPQVRERMGPGAGFIAAYERSVHGAAILRGNAAAANCVDCHGSHEVRKGRDPASRVSKGRIPETCARCHGAIAGLYAGSVHGVALLKGNLEAPMCTDCHGEHDILPHTDPRSPVAASNVSAMVCSPCHSSVRLAEKYGLASDRFKTFSDSYHGLAIRGGSVEAANCASCHGAHDIRRSTDPASSVNRDNLAVTCGRCHPGANQRFGMGAVHVVVSAKEEPLLYWIATLYIGMIVGTVGAMALHNVLDYVRKTRRRLQGRGEAVPETFEPHALYVRMSPGERLQHGALILSFTVLAVTGFMLRYPEAWWVVGLRRLSDNLFELRTTLHRAAAVVLVGAGLVHIGYLIFTERGRQFFRDILPRRQDARDVVRMLGYNLGLSATRPRFARFSYIEKSEYWALIWGTIVMALTGAILWFDNTFMGLLTKFGSDVARTVHFYEAWLATLAILVWHLYFVMFNPDVYPMNPAWITGKITEAQMEDEHPLELEAIRSRREEAERDLEKASANEGTGTGAESREPE
jgi:cytochrome b subunit of formate dehydrogenase